ncbi:MAG: MarR family transcriptional regulator [Treponema sp.]|jgi:DNA-binding MarR family transcriptional regulator|nr:MarR family transcriptional regulator [Treponema sp.]
MNAEILKLENQLCFPLYAAAKAMVKKYTPFLNEIGLTYTQYIVMMVLWEWETISVKKLGEYLYLDSGTLTPLLKRLESKKLISRSRATEDERFVYISITHDGARLKEKAIQVPQKMSECLSLEPQEAQTLYTSLHKLLGKLEVRMFASD